MLRTAPQDEAVGLSTNQNLILRSDAKHRVSKDRPRSTNGDERLVANLAPELVDARAAVRQSHGADPPEAEAFVERQVLLGGGLEVGRQTRRVDLRQALAQQAELARVLRSLGLSSGGDVVTIGAITELSEPPSWIGGDLDTHDVLCSVVKGSRDLRIGRG